MIKEVYGEFKKGTVLKAVDETGVPTAMNAFSDGIKLKEKS